MILDHTHGVANFNCDHPDCRTACYRWTKTYKIETSRGIARTVSGDNIRLHVATLEGAGWSRRAIAGASGVSPTAICRIAAGQQTVRKHVAAAILAVSPDALPSTPSRGITEPFVPKVGAVRRIQALLALGWPHAELSTRCGMRTATVLRQQGRWVTRSTHDAIAAVYRDLSAKPGPSPITRRRAERLGYLTPIAWHDIDHDLEPDAHDDAGTDDQVDEAVVLRILGGDVLPANLAERRAVVARWPSTGRSLNDLAALTGWKPERYRTEEGSAA